MDIWLGVALVAYLIGASIEGVFIVMQLSHEAPAITKAVEDSQTPANQPKGKWRILAVFLAVIVSGAFSWPCRLLHRSLKEQG